MFSILFATLPLCHFATLPLCHFATLPLWRFGDLAILVAGSFCPAAIATGSTSSVPYQRAVSDMVEGASLTYGRAVEFCSTQPGTEEISQSFAAYLRNFEAGTRAGFIAVGAPDSAEPVLTPEGRTVAARTGDDIRKVVQSAPSTACAKLQAELNSGTEARFKNKIVEGMREYKEKRHAFCTKVPRPANCQPNE